MKLSVSILALTPFLLCGSTLAKRSLLRAQEDHERKLQGIPGVAPEAGIIITAIPSLDAELITYETPQAIRFVNYYTAMWWNCMAVYSSTFKDSLTKVRPSVVVTAASMHTSANRGACLAQATATYNFLSVPGARTGFVDAMSSIGISVEDFLDPDVEACGSDTACLQALASGENFSPTIMGQIVAKTAYDYAINDGWNELGVEDGCVVNCRAYKDTTGYEPVNSPYGSNTGRVKTRWQPLLEDNGKGFFSYQEHVTPHIGEKAKFRYLPESDRTDRAAPSPNYSASLTRESMAVIDRMAQLDDVKKIQVEQFDNKLIVGGALINSFVGKLLTDGYDDQELKQPGLIVSLERLCHFAQTLGAADYDATVIAWKEKVNFDLVRPTTVIKERNGNMQITTWAPGGIQTFPTSDFEAYIRVMPHSEYVSGSGCIFETQVGLIEEYLNGVNLDPTSFPIQFPTVPVGSSVVEPGLVPATDITLVFPDIQTMADVGSNSRLDGGMHFDSSVSASRTLCSGIGDVGVQRSFELY